MKNAEKKPTPTSRPRGRPGRSRRSRLDLFELATAKWLRGERLDLTQLAGELGVARTTVFRWVGTREQLYGEVLSAVYARMRAEVVRTTRGTGLERLTCITRRTLTALVKAPALSTFLAQDPEFAIRVVTSKTSPLQARSLQLEVELLREIVAEEGIEPTLDLETLAFIIVRLCEAFLYADAFSGRKPEIEKAVAAMRILVGAGRPVAAHKGRAQASGAEVPAKARGRPPRRH